LSVGAFFYTILTSIIRPPQVKDHYQSVSTLSVSFNISSQFQHCKIVSTLSVNQFQHCQSISFNIVSQSVSTLAVSQFQH